jgi:hypothetical protein
MRPQAELGTVYRAVFLERTRLDVANNVIGGGEIIALHP